MILPISGLYELAKQKKNNGKELTEDEDYCLDECDFDPTIYNGKSSLQELRRLIGERLYANHGKSYIDKLRNILAHAYKLKISALENELCKNSITIKDIEKNNSIEEIQDSISKISSQKEKIEHEKDEFIETSIKPEIRKICTDYLEVVVKTKAKIKKDIEKDIKLCFKNGNYKNVKNWVSTEWTSIFEKTIAALKQELIDIDQDFNEYLGNSYNNFLIKCGINEKDMKKFYYGSTQTKYKIESNLDFEKTYPNSFTNLFCLNSTLQSEFIVKANEKVDEIFDTNGIIFHANLLEEEFLKTSDFINKKIQQCLDNRSKALNDVITNFSSKQDEINGLKDRLEQIKREINKYQYECANI